MMIIPSHRFHKKFIRSFSEVEVRTKNKMKKNENSEEDDYELLEFYPSWAL